MFAPNHTCTWNVASVIEKWNFKFYLIVLDLNLDLKTGIGYSVWKTWHVWDNLGLWISFFKCKFFDINNIQVLLMKI